MKCLNCGKELVGLKKMFCSQYCKSAKRWSRMTEEERVIQRGKNRIRYAEKKEERLKQKKEYYSLNREEIKAKNALYKKLHPETDRKYSRSIKGRYRDYKKGAKKRGYSFMITLDEFNSFKAMKCYYCNDEFEDVGIDRVNNKIGYEKGNMVSCCPVCNRIKNSFSKEEFINRSIKIAKNFNNTKI